ncbi:hypothetical protein IGI37_000175 [Enterococcus sp. AZ194]|uniref:type II toxin-antitoxin system RelE/ParE family toxin n=1 Tax=Enterococcus sp. AZ194 TaxID=2774629 RepID=UPI003F1EA075
MELPEFDWGDEFSEYLESLNKEENEKMISTIKSIEYHGLQEAIKKRWVSKLANDLYEIRVQNKGVFLRGIYFQVMNNNYWITHGFKKKKNKTPQKEIARGKSIRNKYKDRKGD